MRDYSNFKQDILDATKGETILAFRIIDVDYDYFGDPAPRTIALKPFVGKTVQWAEIESVLDFPYDTGYGGQDCPNFYAWTEENVYFIHEYDGSTSIISVPRNPLP